MRSPFLASCNPMATATTKSLLSKISTPREHRILLASIAIQYGSGSMEILYLSEFVGGVHVLAPQVERSLSSVVAFYILPVQFSSRARARAASVLCCRELGRCESCTRRIRPRWRRLDPVWSFRILCCALDASGGATFGPAPAHTSGLSASAAFAGCDPDWVRRVPRGPCWISVSAAWTASTMGWTIADRHPYTRSSC